MSEVTRKYTLYYCDHYPYGYLAESADFCRWCRQEPKPEMGVLRRENETMEGDSGK